MSVDGTAARPELATGDHFRYRRFATGEARPDEYALPDRCSLTVDAPLTPVAERMIADLRAFCHHCMGIALTEGKPGAPGGIRLHLQAGAGMDFDPLDPSSEAHTIEVGAGGVDIRAAHERGLLHGTHAIERWMADRGAPYLRQGVFERKPRFAPRITTARNIDAEQRDAYLSLGSHFGASGVHVWVDLWPNSRNSAIPELNGSDVDGRIQRLNAEAEALARHGLDLYLCVMTSELPPSHPAFLANPARRGASYRVSAAMAPQHVLCSSHDEVRAAHEQALECLFQSVPGAAGAIFIVGGEGCMHCHSRPYGRFEGTSSCPRCRALDPSAAVADWVNRAAAAVKRTGKRKLVFAWPYSAFTWSGKDRAQLRWIERLSDDVLVLSNFDTGSTDRQNGAGVFFYDYNIKSVGPSETFLAQTSALTRQGRKIYAKTESSTTPSVFFTAYVPVHFRWHRRFLEMAEAGVAGYVNQWFFSGTGDTPPEELQYHAVWDPERTTEELLTVIARRDFGLSDADAERAVDGWRMMSEAWDDFPYSAMTAGERECYARGPLHYGPAHPLIFNPQSDYGLSSRFRPNGGTPRYVSELLLALPYGVDRYLQLLAACRARWADGVKALERALGQPMSVRGRMELDVCEIIGIHLGTLEHVVRFYAAREKLWRTPVALPAFREIIDELMRIATAEIANAERSLPIVERDFRVRTYDAEMVREKIRQCRYVLEDELPLFDVTLRFHIWNEFP